MLALAFALLAMIWRRVRLAPEHSRRIPIDQRCKHDERMDTTEHMRICYKAKAKTMPRRYIQVDQQPIHQAKQEMKYVAVMAKDRLSPSVM